MINKIVDNKWEKSYRRDLITNSTDALLVKMDKLKVRGNINEQYSGYNRY